MTDRRAPGEVRDAIVAVLDRSPKRTATVAQIVEGVQATIGGEVIRSSIRSYLNLNEGAHKRFTRTNRGTYKLNR